MDSAAMDPAVVLGFVLSLVAGYAIGSLPISPLIGWRAGVDLYRDGERNPGASNVWRLAGPRACLLASVADLAKGVAAGATGRERRDAGRAGMVTAFAVYPFLFHPVDRDLGHLAGAMSLYLLALGRWLATRTRR